MKDRQRFIFVAMIAAFVFATSPVRSEDAGPRAPSPSLFDQVLELNRVQEPELDADAVRAAFKRLVADARAGLAGAATPEEKISILNRVLLTGRQVSYLSNKSWRDSTLTAALMRGKANCLGTATLYVLVGNELKLPIHLVRRPGHAYVRWDDGNRRINIETTMGGVEIAEGEYETRTPTTPADRALLGWGRSLDENEFLSVLLLEAASHHCGSNRFDQATALVDRVIALQPERIDVKLWRLRLEAIRTSDRAAFRRHVAELLYTADLSPSVAAGAILDLAAELGATGDHETERLLLMRAFAVAPKTKQQQILHRLAFCLRALKDFRGAVRYMELALMMEDDPQGAGMASHLYNLAILQKNDGQLSQALDSIARGRELNPESWSLKIINAGYLVLNGQVEEGEALFARIKDEKPRGREEFYNIMIAWFYAVSEQREQFYAAFTHALEQSRTVGVLHWIDQDVDLDIYRNEPEFQALVRKHRARILGQTEEADEPELKPTGGRSEPAATPDAGSDRTRKVLAQ